jgi:hypothetical protein
MLLIYREDSSSHGEIIGSIMAELFDRIEKREGKTPRVDAHVHVIQSTFSII